MSPDGINVIIDIILDLKPRIVVECGSGTSTIIISYLLKSINYGRVFSLEHNYEYALQSTETLRKHNLIDFAMVIHAPLKETQINNNSWKWYDVSQLTLMDKIDLLIVDGPPGNIQFLSRFPALPLLKKQLSDNAVIALDDTNRKDEKEILNRWLQDFHDFETRYYDTEKGMTILKKTNSQIQLDT